MRKASIFLLSGAAVVLGQSLPALAQVTTSVEAQAVYDDNIYKMQNNKVDSWIMSIRPGAQWSIDQGMFSYTVEGGAESGAYSSRATPGDDAYTDYHLTGQAQIKLDQRNLVEVDASHTHGHDDRGTGRTDVGGTTLAASAGGSSLDPDTWRQDKIAGQYSYGAQNAPGRLTLSGSYADTQYLNNGSAGTDTLNNETGEMRGTGYLKLLPRTSLLLEGRVKKVNFDLNAPGTGPGTGNRDVFEDKLFVGATWEATEKTEGTVRLGHQQHTPDSSSYRSFASNVWEADVIWRARKDSALRFDSYRTIDLSSSTLQYTDTHINSINWLQKWNDVTNTQAYVESTSLNYIDDPRRDRINSFGVEQHYSTREWLTWKASFRHENRSSTAAGFDYDRNIYLVGVDALFR